MKLLFIYFWIVIIGSEIGINRSWRSGISITSEKGGLVLPWNQYFKPNYAENVNSWCAKWFLAAPILIFLPCKQQEQLLNFLKAFVSAFCVVYHLLVLCCQTCFLTFKQYSEHRQVHITRFMAVITNPQACASLLSQHNSVLYRSSLRL